VQAPPKQAISFAASGPIHLRTLRAGHGIPVLFLHGFGGDLSAWRQSAGLIDVPNPLVALDLPGHGLSNALTGVADLAALALAVDKALQQVGIEEVHLVGHSLGAAIAVTLAASGLRAVPSLTLLAPAGLGAPINAGFLDAFLAAQTEAELGVAMAMLVHDKALLTPTLVRATWASRQERQLARVQNQLRQGLFAGNTVLFNVTGDLARFAGDVRIITGLEDQIILAGDDPAHLPSHAALHRMPQVGHMPQLEAMAITARLIAATIRGAKIF
jgi:pimeloyl-ACP methyl ester carboxylesterase